MLGKRKAAVVIALACVVAAAAGVWFFKNAAKGNAGSPPEEKVSGTASPAGDTEDFLLEAESVDLESLKAHGLPIIIDFGSDSCIPCKKMAPVLEKLNGEMRGKAIIKFVDVWKHPEASDGFPVQVIPTQFFFNADGTPYVPGEDLGVEFTLYSRKDSGEHVFTVHQGGLTEDQMRRILADMGVK